MVAKLRKGFKNGKTREKSYRIQQLKNLFRMLEEKEDKILEAGYNDLKKVSIVINAGFPYNAYLCSFVCIVIWSPENVLILGLALLCLYTYVHAVATGLVVILCGFSQSHVKMACLQDTKSHQSLI